MQPTPVPHSTFVLVPGFWLGAWAWDAVATDLRARGHDALALTLPGLDPSDPERASRTLADQVAALAEATAAARARGGQAVLVVHSGAGFPASALLDRDPGAVDRVIYVDSGPSTSGEAYDADFPAERPELPLPEFSDLPASVEGLSAPQLAEFRRRAVPQPGPVIRAPLTLTNAARRAVPSTVIACSFSAAELRQLAASGHPMMAELATLEDVELLDLPTGHWPMWSRAGELAALLADTARS
ncbi:alpha/beta fold hydrolase [Leucobacter sp. M11]|uniref:alpha/beta fold hydrolase n=1 Tax=Leucobacter sp. M11 TaxID=2993565 RepID=UPI002D803657|nr:alpha/beta fold hydrolase [Leucobacter sp. M11]MEB4616151.1 alpha/beta fold hydrolase [Leucobacter sp. M11]